MDGSRSNLGKRMGYLDVNGEIEENLTYHHDQRDRVG